MSRRRLENRRPTERIEFTHDGMACSVMVGFHKDDLDTPAEVFIEGGKPGSSFHAAARDGGLMLSIAMQHGVDLEIFRISMSRLDDGTAAGVIGAAIDAVTKAYPKKEKPDENAG